MADTLGRVILAIYTAADDRHLYLDLTVTRIRVLDGAVTFVASLHVDPDPNRPPLTIPAGRHNVTLYGEDHTPAGTWTQPFPESVTVDPADHPRGLLFVLSLPVKLTGTAPNATDHTPKETPR